MKIRMKKSTLFSVATLLAIALLSMVVSCDHTGRQVLNPLVTPISNPKIVTLTNVWMNPIEDYPTALEATHENGHVWIDFREAALLTGTPYPTTEDVNGNVSFKIGDQVVIDIYAIPPAGEGLVWVAKVVENLARPEVVYE